MEPTPFDPSAPPPAAPRGVAARGPRAFVRAEPRFAVALAGAGCAIVVLGVLLLGGDALDGDGTGGDGSRFPGLLLSAAVVAGGIALLRARTDGPIATAGSVATALGIPPVLFFLSFSESSLPPYSTELILLGSTAAWVALWLVGPGRGRPLFLGAAAIGLWGSVLELTENVFSAPFSIVGSTFGGGSGPADVPDPTTVGFLSLLLGGGYLVVARVWDRQGWSGGATPLTFAALVILPVGVSLLSDELQGVGTGFLALAVGAAVAAHGATVGRRGTTWAGAAGAGLGVVAVVADLLEDPTPGGLGLVVAGAAMVAGAEALRRALDEPDELAPGPSSLGKLGAVRSAAARGGRSEF